MANKMTKAQWVETVLGGAVLAVAASFLLYGANAINRWDATSGMAQHEARFLRAGGLLKGADVILNGVPIGTVTDVFLDAASYEAVVRFEKNDAIPLPKDSVAAIGSDGLTGGKFLIINAGIEKSTLADGDSIARTIDYESLEDKVSQIIFLAAGADE